jgi:hypothetical protein
MFSPGQVARKTASSLATCTRVRWFVQPNEVAPSASTAMIYATQRPLPVAATAAAARLGRPLANELSKHTRATGRASHAQSGPRSWRGESLRCPQALSRSIAAPLCRSQGRSRWCHQRLRKWVPFSTHVPKLWVHTATPVAAFTCGAPHQEYM